MLLDAFGTLLWMEPPGPHLRRELARRAGVSVGERAAAEAFGAEIAYYLDHHGEGRDSGSLRDLRNRCAAVLAGALGLTDLQPDLVREAMLASIRFHAYPEAPAALRALREQGATLVVVSNWDCSLPDVLAEAGLRHLVDAVVSSAEVGEDKPGPGPFRAGLAAAAAGPEEALYVGDSVEADVAGARAASIACALIVREGGPPADLPAGVAVIRGLGEVASLTSDAP